MAEKNTNEVNIKATTDGFAQAKSEVEGLASSQDKLSGSSSHKHNVTVAMNNAGKVVADAVKVGDALDKLKGKAIDATAALRALKRAERELDKEVQGAAVVEKGFRQYPIPLPPGVHGPRQLGAVPLLSVSQKPSPAYTISPRSVTLVLPSGKKVEGTEYISVPSEARLALRRRIASRSASLQARDEDIRGTMSPSERHDYAVRVLARGAYTPKTEAEPFRQFVYQLGRVVHRGFSVSALAPTIRAAIEESIPENALTGLRNKSLALSAGERAVRILEGAASGRGGGARTLGSLSRDNLAALDSLFQTFNQFRSRDPDAISSGLLISGLVRSPSKTKPTGQGILAGEIGRQSTAEVLAIVKNLVLELAAQIKIMLRAYALKAMVTGGLFPGIGKGDLRGALSLEQWKNLALPIASAVEFGWTDTHRVTGQKTLIASVGEARRLERDRFGVRGALPAPGVGPAISGGFSVEGRARQIAAGINLAAGGLTPQKIYEQAILAASAVGVGVAQAASRPTPYAASLIGRGLANDRLERLLAASPPRMSSGRLLPAVSSAGTVLPMLGPTSITEQALRLRQISGTTTRRLNIAEARVAGERGLINPRLMAAIGTLGLSEVGILVAKAFSSLGSFFTSAKSQAQQAGQAAALVPASVAGGPPPPPAGVVGAAAAGGGGNKPPRIPPGPGYATRKGRTFGEAFNVLGSYALAGGIIYGAIDAMREGISTAIKFEEEMLRLQGIIQGQGGRGNIGIVTDEIVQTAAKYGQNLSEVIDLTSFLVQAGKPLSQVAADIDNILGSITGLGIPLNSAKETIIALRSITEGRVDVDIFDRIAAVQQRAAIGAYDLSEALRTTGTIARELRGDYIGLVDELDIVGAATAAVVQKTGVPGSQAATSLRNTLARLGRPEVVASLQGLGQLKLGTIESGGKELRPLLEILKELSGVYTKLKSENRGGELQRLLVQLSGSRQTAAIAAVLADFDSVLETAKASALAFGDAQTRTNTVLEATGLQLRSLGVSMKGLGIGLLQSQFGSLFKTLISGLQGVFSFIGKGTGAAELKLTGLVVGVIGLTKAFRVLGNTLYIALGAKTAEQIAAISIGSGKVAKEMYAIGTAATTSTGGIARTFQFLSKLLSPTGVVLLGIGALVAGFALIKKLTAERIDPLAALQLDEEKLKAITSPKLQAFRDLVAEFSASTKTTITGGTFFQELQEGINTILPSLEERFKAGTLTRKQALDAFTKAMQEQIPVFDTWLNNQLKGYEDLEREGKRIEIIMNLVGLGAFVEGGVLEYGFRQFNNTLTETIGSLETLSSRLLQLQRQGKAPIIGTRSVSFSPQSNKPVSSALRGGSLQDFYTGLKSDLVDSSGAIAALFDILTTAIDETNGTMGFANKDFAARYKSAMLKLEDSSIDVFDGLAVFNALVEEDLKALGTTGEHAVVQRMAATLLKRGRANLALTDVAFPSDAQPTDTSRMISLFSRAQDSALRSALQIATGGKPVQRMTDVLEGLLAGTQATIDAGIKDRLLGLRNPITEFAQKMFFAIKSLDYAEIGAREFGLSLREVNERRLSTFTDLAQEAAQLPIAALKQYVDVLQQQAEAFALSTSGGVAGTEAGGQVARQRAGLAARRQRAEDILRSVDLGGEAISLVGNVRALYDSLDINTGAVDRLVAGIDLKTATRETLAPIILKLFEFLQFGIKSAADKLRAEDLRPQLDLQLRNAAAIAFQDANQAITREILTQQIGVFGVGRTRIQGLGSRLTGISQASQAEQALADTRFSGEISEIRGRRLGAVAEQTAIEELQNKKAIADLERNNTLQKELQLELIRTAYDEILEHENQIQTNLQERLSGVKEILTNYDTFAKGGALRAVLQPAGQSFINRQADQFLKIFSKGGRLGRIGEIIGLAGEQPNEPIMLAHVQGAQIVKNAIIEGHLTGLRAAYPGINLGTAAGMPLTGAFVGQIPGVEGALGALNLPEPSPEFLASINAGFISEADKKKMLKAQAEALGALIGTMGGTAIGGGGVGANIGAQVGSAVGQYAIPIPIVGGLVGGLVGGAIGGLFDGGEKKPPPPIIALEKIARDTGEQVKLLENMNRLMELQNVSFNIPSSFRLPPYGASIGGGQISNEINVEVNVGGSSVSANELGSAVASAIAVEMESQFTSAGSYVSRTRY